jgi:glycosyltransferase involved in cell wall biosynthesis
MHFARRCCRVFRQAVKNLTNFPIRANFYRAVFTEESRFVLCVSALRAKSPPTSLPALKKTLTVAWVSDFPAEWLREVPETLRHLPRRHPATWQLVLLNEFEKNPDLRLHIILLRQRIARSFSFQRNGVTFHVLKAANWFRLGSVFWLDTVLIRRVCRSINPDLVHAWGIEKGAGVIARRLGFPFVMTVQGLMSWYKEVVPMHPYLRFTEWLERRVLPGAPLVTTESKFAVQFLKERYPHLLVHQAEHAPAHAFHSVTRRPQITPIRFISVGGMGFRKGTDLLFAALEQLTSELNFTLIIVSNPDAKYVEELRTRTSDALWRRVKFKYDLPPEKVAQELETATMLLLPTRADTSPNAAKEAVVAGVPVVASAVGGIPDYVVPGKNGLLFPAGDLESFVKVIRMACSHALLSHGEVDAETRERMRDYLSPERMAKNFLAAYERAANS